MICPLLRTSPQGRLVKKPRYLQLTLFFLPPVPEGKSLVEAAMGLRYHVFWRWDFYVVMAMAMTMLTPMLCFAIEGVARRAPSAIAFLLTGKATFRVTNDAADDARASSRWETKATARGPHGFQPKHWGVFAGEILIGAGFLTAVWIHRNLWFLGPGLALILSPLVAHPRIGGWDRWWVRLEAGPAGCAGVFLGGWRA